MPTVRSRVYKVLAAAYLVLALAEVVVLVVTGGNRWDWIRAAIWVGLAALFLGLAFAQGTRERESCDTSTTSANDAANE